MYSLVLMTAMTASPDVPEFNGFFRNLFHGGNGCTGSASSGNCYGSYAPRYSCYGGGSAASASPGNCSGCDGGGFGSRVRRLFDRGNCCGGSGSGYPANCNGSSGYPAGCSGSAGYSCFGSAYSCFGSPVVGYTPVFNGGLSCQGGMPMSAPPPMFDSYPYSPAVPNAAPPSIPFAPPEAAPGSGQANAMRASGSPPSALVSNGGGARATVVVRLPADARLFADVKQLNLTGTERKFVSPELPAGQDFTYRFRAEYERDGETVSVTKKVRVQAGSVVAVVFTDLTEKSTADKPERNEKFERNEKPERNAVAATTTSNSNPLVPSAAPASTPVNPVAAATTSAAGDRATITVKLPEGATLFVDDRKSPSSEAVRQFSTPPLPGGREFAYLMRAEVVRNGLTETFTQKVPFRSGERVEVDFTGAGR